MVDFFLRDGDMWRAERAVHMDDIDLIDSKIHKTPWGPALVAVAVAKKQHVCWNCGEEFIDQIHSPKKSQEVRMGTAIVLLHTQCVSHKNKSYRSFADVVRGLQARRFYAKSVKPLNHLIEDGP